MQNRDEATGYMTRIQFLAGAMMGFYPFATMSRLTLGPTHPTVQWVTEALTPGLKQLWHEADHSLSSCTEVKNAWRCTFTDDDDDKSKAEFKTFMQMSKL